MKAPVQEQSNALALKVDRRSSERRVYPRFEWSTTANISDLSGGPPAQARLADIGLGGCYLDMLAPSPVNTRVHISLEIEKERFGATAEVKFSAPRMGMGLQFISMSDHGRALLEKLLRRLSGQALGKLAGPTYESMVQSLVQLVNMLLQVLEQKGITSKAEIENMILARNRDCKRDGKPTE